MSFTADIPAFFAHMKSEYAYDLKSHKGKFMDVWVIGVDSVEGLAPGFTCLTSFGAMFDRLPISAFVHKKDAPDTPLSWLCMWDNFSYKIEAREWTNIRKLRVGVTMKGREVWPGEYMFTLSWWGNRLSEDPGEGGFKRGHVIKCDNGTFVIQPGNRLRWFEPSFITEPFPAKPDFLTNNHTWKCESGRKWATENSDAFFYDTQEEPESCQSTSGNQSVGTSSKSIGQLTTATKDPPPLKGGSTESDTSDASPG